MNRKVDLSVVIPCYNVSETIEETVNSVVKSKASSRLEIEILLINDGSTDNTLKIISDMRQNSSYIRVFSQENRGVSSARNLGISKSRGEYIVFLDGDDLFDNTYLSKVHDVLSANSSHPKLDLIISGYSVYEDSELRKQLTKFERKNLLANYLSGKTKICTGSIIINKTLIEENKLSFKEEFSWSEDVLFYALSIYYSDNVALIEDYMLIYRNDVQDGRLSNFDLNKINDDIVAMTYLYEFFKEQNEDYLAKVCIGDRLPQLLYNRLFIAKKKQFRKEDICFYLNKANQYPIKRIHLRTFKVFLIKYYLIFSCAVFK